MHKTVHYYTHDKYIYQLVTTFSSKDLQVLHSRCASHAVSSLLQQAVINFFRCYSHRANANIYIYINIK